MNIDFANLQLQYQKYKTDIDAKIQAVLNKSNYIMGEEVFELERALEEFTGAKHAITCSSGTFFRPFKRLILGEIANMTFESTFEISSKIYLNSKKWISGIGSYTSNYISYLISVVNIENVLNDN